MKEQIINQTKKIFYKYFIPPIIIVGCIIFLFVLNQILINRHKKTKNKLININEKYENGRYENEKISRIRDKISKLININEKNKTEILNLSYAIYFYSQKYDQISKELLISLIYQESTFNKYAISYVNSNKGCVGYGQINEDWHQMNQDLKYDPFYNLGWMTKIYLKYYKKYNGNEILALNKYNGWGDYNNPYGHNIIRRKKFLEMGN